MAILENETDNYFKINFNNCSIKGRSVYVNFSVYKTENERQKEKDRESKFAKFFLDLRQYLDEKYRILLTAIGELTPEEILSSTEPGKIDEKRYPKLKLLQDDANELLPFEQIVSNAIYRFSEELNVAEIDASTLEKLKALGLDNAWITDPIFISSGAEVYCGEYNEEHIDMQFYYDRLKTVMSQNIEDC